MNNEFDNFDTPKRELLIALKASLGIISTACEKAKVSRQSYYNYCRDDVDFKLAVDDIIDRTGDFVEGKLLKKIEGGDTTATIFYCKTKLKNRGYVERVENTGKDGEPLVTRVTLNIGGDKDVKTD